MTDTPTPEEIAALCERLAKLPPWNMRAVLDDASDMLEGRSGHVIAEGMRRGIEAARCVGRGANVITIATHKGIYAAFSWIASDDLSGAARAAILHAVAKVMKGPDDE